MSWNQDQFLASLKTAVDKFDGEGTAKLCRELVDHLENEESLQPELGREVLATLRRKCYFDQMERVANAFHKAGIYDRQVRRQYAQSLIDQGKLSTASDVLELLVERTAEDPRENAEARGLLGRVYKQLYIEALKEDAQAVQKRSTRCNLQTAVSAYHAVYRSDPARHLWHGINTVALCLRAEKDSVGLEAGPDARAIAREILGLIETEKQALEAEGKTLGAWSLATALEASVALGDTEQAHLWLVRYVQHEDADAFELSSTERQLREIWGLTVDEPPGLLLLPTLQAALLKRKFGRVELPGPQVNQTLQQTLRLEKTFGSDRYVPFSWYAVGLERCRGVAQIRNAFRGLGTGFLIRGSDLALELGDSFLLLTNAHVVSNDANVRASTGALYPDEAFVVFEALESVAGQKFRVARLLWTSPPGELDSTLLQLNHPPEIAQPFPIAGSLPPNDGKQKVYVTGHPLGGELSISLTDNALIGYDQRLLHYRAPTEPGSSGSPVFDDQWRLIGLHHAGRSDMNRLDGKPGTYEANEGIQIQRIIEAIRKAKIAL